MAPLFEVFLEAGGIWLAILAALAWISYGRLGSIEDDAERWRTALARSWLMRTAVGLALAAWVVNSVRLFLGAGYLVGAGSVSELSTVVLGAVLAAAGVAWYFIRPGTPAHPWVTYGLVLVLILTSAPLLGDGPQVILSQDTGGEQPRTVAFVQRRLASLGCFGATGEPDRTDGTFEALTAGAVIAFQLSNGLIQDPKLDTPGVVRPEKEFRLLTRPLPFLWGPKPCPLQAGGRRAFPASEPVAQSQVDPSDLVVVEGDGPARDPVGDRPVGEVLLEPEPGLEGPRAAEADAEPAEAGGDPLGAHVLGDLVGAAAGERPGDRVDVHRGAAGAQPQEPLEPPPGAAEFALDPGHQAGHGAVGVDLAGRRVADEA